MLLLILICMVDYPCCSDLKGAPMNAVAAPLYATHMCKYACPWLGAIQAAAPTTMHQSIDWHANSRRGMNALSAWFKA